MMFKSLVLPVGLFVAALAVASQPFAFPAPQDAPDPVVLGSLPEGPGRETTALVCTQCHAIGMVTSQKHTRAEWDDVITRMVDDFGLAASDDERSEIAAYLTAEFGKKTGG
jgi:cytochrome c5